MRQIATFHRNRRAFAAVLVALAAGAVAAAGAGWAQQAPAISSLSRGEAGAQASAPDTKANDELLAKTAKMYYSTRAAGLDGFDCDVHPDWRTLFSSANNGATLPDDDARLTTLKPVKIALHARMAGGSTMEWNRPPSPDKPLDADSTAMLDQLHQATEQTLQGFLQFWTPFVDGSVVPASSEGLTDHPVRRRLDASRRTERHRSDGDLLQRECPAALQRADRRDVDQVRTVVPVHGEGAAGEWV